MRTPGTVRTRARTAWRPAVVVLAAVGLFALYWRQSESVAVSSDGAGNVLQAWAMLHGNLLLHDWRVSDVSFYTTELPQYALIESVLGLGAQVVHAGAAMTYTLLVFLAAWLAKGSARGRVGWTRALLAAGIMVAPQLSATQVLLLSPDHTGTAVPVLVTWLVIDRVTPDRPSCAGCSPRRRTRSAPQRTYRYDGCTIMVWNVNLLRRLGHPGIVLSDGFGGSGGSSPRANTV